MRFVKLKELVSGQIVLAEECKFGVGKFSVAEFDEVVFHFKNWKKVDMDNGTIKDEKNGTITKKVLADGIKVLNLSEIKKLRQIEDKMKMLKNLKNKENKK